MGVVGNSQGCNGDFEKCWVSRNAEKSERKNNWSWLGLATHNFHVWDISWNKDTVQLGSIKLNTNKCYKAQIIPQRFNSQDYFLFIVHTSPNHSFSLVQNTDFTIQSSSPIIKRKMVVGNIDWVLVGQFWNFVDRFNKPESHLILPPLVTKKRAVFGCLDYKNVLVFMYLQQYINDPLLYKCN